MSLNKFRYIQLFKSQLKRLKLSLLSEKVDLLFFDDIYPHPMSGFRLEEFTILLSHFDNSKILLNPSSYRLLGTPKEQHQNDVEALVADNRMLHGRLMVQKKPSMNAKLFYCVFLTNILRNLNWLEQHSIPFVFTLYPGGGFKVNDKKTDEQLRAVFQSEMFKKVIVTQEFTKDYLLENKFCDARSISNIFGCVVPQNSIQKDLSLKSTFNINKETFDICFCAAKYSEMGRDKGYDLFIAAAHEISSRYEVARFHVIGGFDKSDIDVEAIQENISFYGYQSFNELSTIYQKMDVIISPNQPFILSDGAFDGFPLGTVVEAALNGVVALVSDVLHQNQQFIDKEDLIIIEPSSDAIVSEISNLIENPDELYEISKKGRIKFSSVYSNSAQMTPRIEILNQELSQL